MTKVSSSNIFIWKLFFETPSLFPITCFYRHSWSSNFLVNIYIVSLESYRNLSRKNVFSDLFSSSYSCGWNSLRITFSLILDRKINIILNIWIWHARQITSRVCLGNKVINHFLFLQNHLHWFSDMKEALQ